MPPLNVPLRAKNLHSFYGKSKNHAKSWDNVFIKNCISRANGRFSHQMPARRPGFGGGRPGDTAFNQMRRSKEAKYLDYLKLYAKAKLVLESKGRAPAKADLTAMDTLLKDSGFEVSKE